MQALAGHHFQILEFYPYQKKAIKPA